MRVLLPLLLPQTTVGAGVTEYPSKDTLDTAANLEAVSKSTCDDVTHPNREQSELAVLRIRQRGKPSPKARRDRKVLNGSQS